MNYADSKGGSFFEPAWPRRGQAKKNVEPGKICSRETTTIERLEISSREAGESGPSLGAKISDLGLVPAESGWPCGTWQKSRGYRRAGP